MKKLIVGAVTTLCMAATVGAMATEVLTANAVKLVFERETLENPPPCVLSLEEAKIKNMTEWEYCRVDDEYDAWYFYGDGSALGDNDPEIRFVADGVQTVTKPYTLTPIEVASFSFQYCIVNNAPSGVADLPNRQYIVQILGSDGLYPVIPVDIEEDGYWHTVTVDGTTAFYGSTGGNAITYGEYDHKFCGFLFKLGGLDGEFMIKDITLYDANGDEISSEGEAPDGESSNEEGSEETSSETESTSSGVATSQSGGAGESFTSQSGGESGEKGCGSFGVGTVTLGMLAAASVALCVGKRKRK